MPSRERGSLSGDPLTDPLTDPLPVAADAAVLEELAFAEVLSEELTVEPAQTSWAQDTTQAPAASLSSESAFDTETIPTMPEQPAPSAERVEEPAINGSSKSSWLSTDEQDHAWTSTTEVEAGWQRADTVAETHDESTNDYGLPVRRPGARLVPGSVTKPVGNAGRDPEAIRARLSAHKAGVRRGRTASVPADDQ